MTSGSATSGFADAPPLVAVSATEFAVDGRQRVGVNARYVHALTAAGAVPLLLPARLPEGGAPAVLRRVHALLLTGGGDVAPERYGQPVHPATHAPEPGRDELELALLAEAERRALPTLAICRGVQVLNVHRGGSLVQDIPTQRAATLPHKPGGPRDARVHPVSVAADSRLAAALGARQLDTNSSHHQSVDQPGTGLRVVALAPDGIVEGLEVTDARWWAVGVQWHPEELVDDGPWDRALFAAFVAEARRME